MKKVSAALFLTAALSLGASAYAQTTNPTGQVDNPTGQSGLQKPEELRDIPAGHWASEAIKVVSNCGIIRGYPDGTFRGSRPITRYEAAAMVARLIEAIRTGQCELGNGPGQINNEQLVVLQNAIQELAADLAQLGVRVAELEDNAVTQDDLARVEEIASQARDLAEAAAGNAGGADGDALQIAQDALALAEAAQPAGDYATQDDLAAVAETAQQALDAIEALTGIDPEALAELGAQVEAASIAADTALAQSRELQDKVDELSGRVDDLTSELGELGATVEGQAESITALNDLVVLLNQDVLALQDRVGNLERQVEELTAAVQDGSGDFATQDDLEEVRADATGLRRDQAALTERVGALEDRVTAVESRTTALEGRVTTLEANAFTVSGSISLTYYTARTWFGDGSGPGPNFDVDRLYFNSPFSTGDINNDDNADDSSRDYGDFSRTSVDSTAKGTKQDPAFPNDPTKTVPDPKTRPSVAVNAGNAGTPFVREEGYIKPGITLTFGFKPRALVGATTNGIGSNFSITLGLELVDPKTPFTTPGSSSETNVATATFKLTGLSTKFTVGNAPLTIAYGEKIATKFTNYAFNSADGRGDGFVATLDASPLVPGLNPTLTFIYGSKGGLNADFLYYTGVRGTLSLIPGLTGGVYFGYEGPDIFGNPALYYNTYGLDFKGKLFGLLDLEGEYNVHDPAALGGTGGLVATYVKGGANLDVFTIGANYRVIDYGHDLDTVGVSNTEGPYKQNQRGFGVDVGLKKFIGFLDLSFYYDQRSRTDQTQVLGNGPKSDTQGGAGVNAETDFGFSVGFGLLGINFTVSGSRQNEVDNSGNSTTGALYDRTVLDAKAAIGDGKGVFNVVGGYNSTTDGLAAAAVKQQSTIYVYANANLDLGGLVIAPEGYFTSRSNRDFTTDNVTALGGGLGINSGFLFGSKLALNFAYDQATHSAPAFTANTVWATAAVSFDPALFGTPSKFTVAYGFRNDQNRNGKKAGPSFDSPIAVNAWGTDTNGTSSVLNGLYFTFEYYGIAFRYGIFSLNSTDIAFAGGKTAWGQAFGISYSLKF